MSMNASVTLTCGDAPANEPWPWWADALLLALFAGVALLVLGCVPAGA